MVRVWNLTGTRVRSYDEKSPCRSLSVLGARFAVGTAEGTMTVYDLATEALVKRLRGRPLSVTALAFSPGGTRLMAGYFDGGIESIDIESWTVAQFSAGKGDRVLSIEGNPAQNIIVVGYGDGYAKVCDTASLREIASIQPGPVREIFAARWVLDDDTFALAGASNGITFWKVKSGVQGVGVLNLGSGGARVDAELTKGIQNISYEVKFAQGKTYVIDMIAPAGSPVDPFLRLLDPSGKEVASDDDSGGGLNARITYAAKVTGAYRIIATSFGSSVGQFTLMVKER
jgi:WD40 repeat protein